MLLMSAAQAAMLTAATATPTAVNPRIFFMFTPHLVADRASTLLCTIEPNGSDRCCQAQLKLHCHLRGS
jgi:hypothetical protein